MVLTDEDAEDLGLAPGSKVPSRSGGAFEWQKTRRRPEVIGGIPVQGFGPAGAHTLWLPPPQAIRKVKFVGGKPQVTIVGATIDDPELKNLREKLIATAEIAAVNGAAIVRLDLTILEYAAALISRTYKVSDDDLEFILPFSGSPKWIESIVIHALGGKENRDALAKLRSAGRPEAIVGDVGEPVPLE
jgi:hypothetical protein